MAGCSVGKGDGCKDMIDIKDTVYGKDGRPGLKTTVDKMMTTKVSWRAFVGIAGSVFVLLILVVIYFSDIRVMAKDFPKTKEQVNSNTKNVAVLDERTKTMLAAQNTTNDLLRKLLKQNENKSHNKSKDIDRDKDEE